MQKFAVIILGLALGAGIALRASAQTRELGASGELLDGIAALVNSGVVLKSDIETRIPIATENFIQQQLQLPAAQRSQLPPISAFEQGVMNQLILEEIQYQRARQIGIQIGDDDLNRYMSEYARQVGTTLDGFPAWMESQGIDYNLFREEQRRDLAIRTLERAEVVQRIAINPRELEQCLAQARESQADEYEYNISHLLVSIPSNPTPQELAEAEAKIREVERELEAGADFAELAVEFSSSQTNLQGGSLGWRKGAELPTFFANDIRQLEPGDHSPTIR
jgi:peptidyl-prolyl cis-trans isomerase SurA